MKIRWLAIAFSDIERLYQHIAKDNPNAAGREVARVIEAVENLSKMSALGRPGRVPDTRELVISQYFIAYRGREGWVEILRVLHHAQRWPEKKG